MKASAFSLHVLYQECINNIEDVSNSRLEVTQKMVDIELELTKLEEKEY